MIRYLYHILFILITIIIFTIPLQAKDKDRVKIGIIFDGYLEQSTEYIVLVKKEIIELTEDEFRVSFPENKMIAGNWNVERIKTGVAELLSDKEIDIILTLGVIASNEIATKDQLNKPVIAPFILNPEMQEIPVKDGSSGVKNLCYIHTPFTSENTLLDFQSVVDFKNMAFLFNKFYLEIIPSLEEQIQRLAESLGINFYPFRVDDSIEDVFKDFPPQIEAVYVSPLLHLPETEFDKLVIELNKRNLPSFSLMGKTEVERGLLTTNRPDIFPRLARRIALNVQRILLGDKLKNIAVYFDPGAQIAINMETARAINIFPNVDILTEAELIKEEKFDPNRSLDLNQAINEAIKANLDVLAKRRFVSAESENIDLARSELLPQFDISALGLVIDKDRAESSFGSQPERSISGSISVTQLLYSEPAWANLSIQNSIQRSRESELEQLQLDITLAAATAFYNIMRAKTFESIQKENLRRTKSNLEMANVRSSVGSAGPAEIYRWESELANNRNSVIRVIAEKNIARINLNRLLHRNLNEQVMVIDQNIYSDELSNPDNLFTKYFRDPRLFAVVQDFLVKEGMKNSPELLALENAIQAQERALTSAKNSFWAPTLALQGEYSSLLSKSGAGSERLALTPNFSLPDDNTWNVALNMSFPLFSSGKKFAARRQSQEKLNQLQLEYQSIAEKIEQQIRSTLYITGASFASITQTRLASEAANKSLKVVQDGYAEGIVSILDLLDAQNTALISQELAANAVFDFIVDLMTVERATGRFYLQMSEEDAQDYLSRLEAFISEAEF